MNYRIIALMLVLGGLTACRPFVHYDPNRLRSGSSAEQTQVHTVSKGETLYSIAFQYGHDYRTVARWNGIRSPYTIYPGQEIRFNAGGASEADTISTDDDDKPVTTARHRTGHKRQPAAESAINWQWPVDGEILSSFSATDPGKKGLDIAGKLGQSVHAAAEGKVVYSGNGLRGYGNLVIIKHNATFFSAYAHNDRLYVKEEDTVKSGQHIADMGKSGSDRVKLHFEIRRNGVPANPLTYLPKKGS